jgi:hypothetical protein
MMYFMNIMSVIYNFYNVRLTDVSVYTLTNLTSQRHSGPKHIHKGTLTQNHTGSPTYKNTCTYTHLQPGGITRRLVVKKTLQMDVFRENEVQRFAKFEVIVVPK